MHHHRDGAAVCRDCRAADGGCAARFRNLNAKKERAAAPLLVRSLMNCFVRHLGSTLTTTGFISIRFESTDFIIRCESLIR